ncbi:MAG: hypothetical protein OEY56_10000 [Cyclobacteriaceae bacterium]|nr:hypothetical protein [Cyclobacteriaceae bacterium]
MISLKSLFIGISLGAGVGLMAQDLVLWSALGVAAGLAIDSIRKSLQEEKRLPRMRKYVGSSKKNATR